jgi:hypothetical protein
MIGKRPSVGHYYIRNNGLVYTPTGEKQGSGPDTEIQNIGTFIQGDYAITDQLNIQAGYVTNMFRQTLTAI